VYIVLFFQYKMHSMITVDSNYAIPLFFYRSMKNVYYCFFYIKIYLIVP